MNSSFFVTDEFLQKTARRSLFRHKTYIIKEMTHCQQYRLRNTASDKTTSHPLYKYARKPIQKPYHRHFFKSERHRSERKKGKKGAHCSVKQFNDPSIAANCRDRIIPVIWIEETTRLKRLIAATTVAVIVRRVARRMANTTDSTARVSFD